MLRNTGVQARKRIAASARALYASAPPKARFLQSLRPFICPFEELIVWMPINGRLLDVGCGAGLFVGLVCSVRPNLRAIGFDADKAAISAAQSMANAHFPDNRAEFRHSAVGDTWPEGKFDVVSMIDVLHHIPPAAQAQVIADAYSHVRTGGVFIYKDMAAKPLFRAWWNRLHDLVIARQWISYRPINEVEVWLKDLGAEIVEHSEKVLGPYGHELIVAKRPA